MACYTPIAFILALLFILVCNCSGNDLELEAMNEDEISELLKEEKYVVVLFSEKEECTDVCGILEETLLSIREELVEVTGAWVVRGYAPIQAKNYGLKSAAVIFVRSGQPLLYTGPKDNDDYMLNYFLINREQNVRILTDDTFEHQTQAGTGSTTGDWLVMFIKEDCTLCHELRPTLEAVAASIRSRKNVAIVNRDADGAVTARRFGVKEFPGFLLFRMGRVFAYSIQVYEVPALIAFAEDGFRNTKGTTVPAPKSPFDDVTEAAADWLKENPGTFLGVVSLVTLVIAILVALNITPPESWSEGKKNK